MNETPILRQLLVCEKLVFERDTNNVSLINCHSIRRADRFPTRPIAFGVYGLLTDGFGSFTVTMRITRLETGEDLFQRGIPMYFGDRLRTADFACRVADFVFPAKGPYEIDLRANDEFLGATLLTLKEA